MYLRISDIQFGFTAVGGGRDVLPSAALYEGREGVKWELGYVFFLVCKWDFVHWDWDS